MSSTETNRNAAFEVIFAWNYLEWGGAQMYFLGIARRIKDRCRIRFVFPEGTDQQFIDFVEAEGFRYDTIDRPADLGPAPGLVRKLRRHLTKIRSEIALVRAVGQIRSRDSVVHIELSPWQSLSALLFLTAKGPVFSTMHNRLPGVSPVRAAIWRLKFAVLTRIRRFHIFPSNRDAKASLGPFCSEAFLDRTVVTYTNVNADEIETAAKTTLGRESERGRFGIDPDVFLVLTVGQFIDRKGRWETLEAAKMLANRGVDVTFAWISNSNLSADDLARIDSYGLGGRFRLISSADVGREHIDLMRFLHCGDAFSLPSHVEGLPISLLEAMASGLPAVSTEVNAIPEAITDRETGLLVKAGDAAALAEAVAELAADGELRARIASAGRTKVLAEFTEQEVAGIAFAEYRRAIGGGR